IALGVMLAGQAYWLLLLLALFYAAIYFPVMKAEEDELAARYGLAFREYAARVPLFLPSFRSAPQSPAVFQWSRVIRNGEHRNFAGLLLIEAVLIVIKLVR